MKWICCQLGAREHYAIPRALRKADALSAFYTDAWVSPASPTGWLPGRRWARLQERYHPDLAGHNLRHATLDVIAFEAASRRHGWDRILARNEWFERWVVRELRWEARRAGDEPRALFSYSYTAREPFRAAKERGWFTVLGQIDPGPVEERLVGEAHAAHPGLKTKWHPAPAAYWKAWREECELADCVMVNSEWSREALMTEGVPGEKIAVVPLVYEPPPEAAGFQRTYPDQFTPERPLRVLFLGQVNVRKGMGHVLEAMRRMRGRPVEWWIVGPAEFPPPEDLAAAPGIRWTGPVARGETARCYREADVFLFPTLSDGFGLTQLEAMTWRLPVIATQRCGDAVTDGVDGLRLSEVSADSIVSAVESCLAEPGRLARWAERAPEAARRFTLDGLSQRLTGLARAGAARPVRTMAA